MKLWQKDFDLDRAIEDFTVGDDKIYDMLIAKYDVVASIAHARMLKKVGLIDDKELEQLIIGLQKIGLRIHDNDYSIESGIEDIHSQIELDLVRDLGETGKKIHMGRSRNDQVLVALKLYYRDQINQIHQFLVDCIKALLQQAEANKDRLMPGYTHSQIGMVSSFGLWFSAFAESLVDDANYLKFIQKQIDQNPLGSAAGYGNSFPLDRDATTQDLGFHDISINVMYAQMTRGKAELLLSHGLSALALSINKFATDVCLFVNANFDFISLPKEITTGSSIMPHKKNPDVFELIRAKCNQLLSAPHQITLLLNNMMSGYHRDVQLLKEVVFPSIERATAVLQMLEYCIPKIECKNNLLDDAKYDYLFSVENVNAKVLSGQSFRDAYKEVGMEIEKGQFEPNKTVKHTHLGSIHHLALDRILDKLEN